MNRLKFFISCVVLTLVLSCSWFSRKINEKVYEQERENKRKVDSIIMQEYKDTLMKELDKNIKILDSMRVQSDSSMKELEKSMKKLNKRKTK
jgi:hypothetical protein